jgi:hypothetical protein
MAVKYAKVPVVAAPFQMTLGGGCEFCLHADRINAHAETYMGLVEIGVGLLPGGGGTKEMCLRAVDLGARPRVTPASEIIHYGGASEPVRSDRMVKVLTAKVSLMRRHWSLPRAKAGVALLAAWPLTRWCALAIAARLSGNPIWHARADEWAEIFRRRNIWLAGYAPQQRVQPPSAQQQHGSHRRASDPQPSSAVAAQSRPEISVLIPHLDDPGNLAVCIKALRNQTLASDRYEIVVCDNGSQCGLQPVWQAAGGATVVTTAEKGAGPARNAAFAASRGRILAFTDSDCIPANDWLEKGLAALEHADLAGGHRRVRVVARLRGEVKRYG